MALRKKTPHAVLTFPTTQAAMAFEEAARAHDLPGRMIPVPSAISAGCGLSWCAPTAKRDELLHACDAYQLDYEGVHTVDLY